MARTAQQWCDALDAGVRTDLELGSFAAVGVFYEIIADMEELEHMLAVYKEDRLALVTLIDELQAEVIGGSYDE